MGDAAELAMEAEHKSTSVPVWCNYTTVPDPEVLVLVCERLMDRFFKLDYEDSRTIQAMLIETALEFDKRHESDDPDYWCHRDILDDIDAFCEEVWRAVGKAGIDWVNDDHRTMYGKQTIGDLLK